ncbi:hypothetical protein NDI85_06110 [Halomicroarcula sp. S1AR25-4]|uniref:hypothetical protein n=1 Tax=Haloarcula sp. S1AR25-4 TaxID=2950538 RepID=UPI0028747838|nr:hypothetical protein [Halomicroarcula sp. S1AR25-4]MDS0277360.1 hypothetical protein [Halomicroarcula sp. S1AR25-4]
MREILGTPGEEDADIEAKRHAAAALDGIVHAEDALRLWRDREEEAIEMLGEEPRDDGEGQAAPGRHLSDSSGVDTRAMDDKEKLKARLAMFVSGSSGWITEAKDADVDDEVIKEAEEAHQHAREAFDMFRDDEG